MSFKNVSAISEHMQKPAIFEIRESSSKDNLLFYVIPYSSDNIYIFIGNIRMLILFYALGTSAMSNSYKFTADNVFF